jgi:hypothetical protein
MMPQSNNGGDPRENPFRMRVDPRLDILAACSPLGGAALRVRGRQLRAERRAPRVSGGRMTRATMVR